MVALECLVALPCGLCAGGFEQGEFAPQPVRAECDAQFGAIMQDGVGRFDFGQSLARLQDLIADFAVFGLPCGQKRICIMLKRIAAADDFDPFRDVIGGFDLDREAKAVQQLRPQFALFGVTGADQHKAGRVSDGQPFAFHDVFA